MYEIPTGTEQLHSMGYSAPPSATSGDGRRATWRPTVDPQQLSFHRLSPRDAGLEDVPLLGAAYEMWSRVWKATFGELKAREDLPSDDFTRQDEVRAIFHGYECIALFVSRFVDLSSPLTQDDSYFKAWPEAARKAACAQGSKVCVSSNITIPPEWRRPENCNLSLLLCALIVESFLLSDSDILVGTMRTDRRMHELAYAVGAQPLMVGVQRHGVPVELVGFFRDECTRPRLDKETEKLVQMLKPRSK